MSRPALPADGQSDWGTPLNAVLADLQSTADDHETELDTKADSSSLGTAASHAATDFATSAQGTKADSAYQKPSTGIPATDLDSSSQTALTAAAAAVPNTRTVNGKALSANITLSAPVTFITG